MIIERTVPRCGNSPARTCLRNMYSNIPLCVQY